ncbi:UNVERIFIED_CONTAM: hypothetical protein Sradi_2666400 [Sesamum radiatum]|uniref:Endonuclease/exonuclease/phosphatase domain-containing protein n=1 Tax=Sesamum radiatum TaxID=300843 RepID=A0AAW2S5R0_SESRA
MELSRLGGPLTARGLESLIKTHHPSLVFLLETKCSSFKIGQVRYRFRMNGIGFDCEGRSGGLALLWDKSISCTLRSFSKNHIDVTVMTDDISPTWRFTGFYGDTDITKRKLSWELLKQLSLQSNREWLVAGDFNEILMQSEKFGISVMFLRRRDYLVWALLVINLLGATDMNI